MDTHLPTPSQDIMINARKRAAAPFDDVATHLDFVRLFHNFDAKRYAWLAQMLRDAGREPIAKLADEWALEHAETASKLAALDAPAVLS